MIENPRLLFAHRLVANGIGGRTVAELNENMTVAEFARWEAFDQFFPVGYDDLHFARLMQLLASIYSKPGNSPKVADFLLGELPEAPPTPEQLAEKFNTLAMLGGAHREN